MRLISLEIQGFKSFAPRTIVQFGSGVTGVIGPNGSGKSNIAEAIRWVLGEQSMKTLRGKERTDVIYSDDSSQASSAKVTLTFDNESSRFPIGAGEVSISRTLSRDGESKYLINNEPVRLIDLQQMLAEAGIGAKSYTVISQGMIDRYLTASPQDRKELFDEATGIKSLQIKIAQAQQRMKKSQEHAQEVRALLEEITPRLTFLKRQMDRYDERDMHLALFQEQQSTYFHQQWASSSQLLKDAHSKLEQLHTKIVAARERRIAAEKTALDQAAHENPARRLQQEIATAHSQYLLELERWTRQEQERGELTESLASLSSNEERLITALKEFTNQKKASDIHAVLEQCRQLFQRIISGTMPDAQSLNNIITLIGAALTASSQSSESPAIELARVRAIIDERTHRLKAIPKTPKPSDDEAESLQKQLKELPPSSTGSHDSANVAEQAREEELQAEREGASQETEVAQLTSAHHVLEQEIVRERGAEMLKHISQTPAPKVALVREDTLRTLAAKIAAIGERDELIDKEYEETRQRYESMNTQLLDVEGTMRNIQASIEELARSMKESFDTQFSTIQKHFSSYFTSLFGGGSATLQSTEDGIEITVIPPGKRARHITLLSGGERALTSLALLFAILDTQKPPFIVLDEVDAALDEANSHRFAALLRERSGITQSIVISHNRETMAQSDMLYGVTMGNHGVSSMYSVKITDYTA